MKPEQTFAHTHCLVRGLPESFLEALAMHPPPEPIDLALAAQQHEGYTALVKRLVAGVSVEVPADNNTPDCVSAAPLGTSALGRDTAIAVITRPGAPSRRLEVGPVKRALEQLGFAMQPSASAPHQLYELTEPATLDGGDVLFTGRETGLWIGLSQRTNQQAVDQLKELLRGVCPVYGFEMLSDGPALHFKSLMTALSEDTIVVADIPQGHALVNLIQNTRDGPFAPATRPPPLEFVYVPDMLCSNILRIGPHVVMQAGYPKSEAVLRPQCEKRGLTLHTLEMGEFAKADGALTCCSLLFSL